MNDSGKIYPKLPFFVLETLNKDSITFQLNPNRIFNLVYQNLRDSFENLKVEINGKYDTKKNLTLCKELYQEYIDITQVEIGKKYSNLDETAYFRSLLYQYCTLPVFEREEVLFKNNYDKLQLIKN